VTESSAGHKVIVEELLPPVAAVGAGRAAPVAHRDDQVLLDATVAFQPPRGGLALTCGAGVFLVTQERDPCDHVLEPGDAFRTTSRGRVVAWAFQPGVLIARRAQPS
jgi:hypothetical protein